MENEAYLPTTPMKRLCLSQAQRSHLSVVDESFQTEQSGVYEDILDDSIYSVDSVCSAERTKGSIVSLGNLVRGRKLRHDVVQDSLVLPETPVARNLRTNRENITTPVFKKPLTPKSSIISNRTVSVTPSRGQPSTQPETQRTCTLLSSRSSVMKRFLELTSPQSVTANPTSERSSVNSSPSSERLSIMSSSPPGAAERSGSPGSEASSMRVEERGSDQGSEATLTPSKLLSTPNVTSVRSAGEFFFHSIFVLDLLSDSFSFCQVLIFNQMIFPSGCSKGDSSHHICHGCQAFTNSSSLVICPFIMSSLDHASSPLNRIPNTICHILLDVWTNICVWYMTINSSHN